MTDRIKLAEELEAAQGPSREMDTAIRDVLQLGFNPKHPYGLPSFTGSVDAALMLVPEGWSVKLCVHPPKIADGTRASFAEVYKLGDIIQTETGPLRPYASGGSPCEAEAATPALALASAALKAGEG